MMKTQRSSTTLLNDKTKNPQRNTFRRHIKGHSLSSPAGIGAIFALIIAAALFTSLSVSASRRVSHLNLSAKAGTGTKNQVKSSASRFNSVRGVSSPFSLLPQSTPTPTPVPEEAIATFAVVNDACTNTPKSRFELGEKVCARATNAPADPPAVFRSINWANTNGFVLQSQDVTTSTQEDIYTLPQNNTSVVDGQTVDNRGTWTVSLNSTDHTTRAIAYFTVSDPANLSADLVVYNFSTSADPIEPGTNTGFFLWISNSGPDPAVNVHVTQAVPPYMTFLPPATTSSAFTCAQSNGVVDCSVAVWASGAAATITLNYSVSAGAPNGVISSTANISSDTFDPRLFSNTSDAQVEIRAAGAPPATCGLSCPADITVSANTTDQNGNPGAVVHFDAPTGQGDCGAITTGHCNDCFFPVGTTVVTATAASGGSCSFSVTVTQSGGRVTISCPPNKTANADSNCEANVDLGTPTTTGDNVTVRATRSDGLPMYNCDANGNNCTRRVPDDPFPAGVTTVTWTASNSSGTVSCQQTVTVSDTTAPTITCPANVTANNDPGACGAVVTYTAPVGTDNCDGATTTQTAGLASGSTFPVGTTTNTFEVTDASGNKSSCSFTVTVNDTEKPAITCPANITKDSDPGACGAVVTYTAPVGADNCGGATTTQTAGLASGSPFPVGTTTNTFEVTDASGNKSSCSFTVTVKDTENPAITCPANITRSTDPGTCSANIDPGTATATDNCGSPTVTGTRSDGQALNAPYPKGTTTITWTATDGSGNHSSCAQTITVNDTEAPAITCPANITHGTDPGTCSAAINPGTATATDNCGSPTVTGTRSDGQALNAPYPKGTTTITWTATDSSGNRSSCTQTVTVVDDKAPVITVSGQQTMWPPNHKYHTFGVTNFVTGVNDNCDTISVSSVVIVKVTSDEAENGNGDGNTFNDIIIAPDCKSVQLRSEREGGGDGRVYRIFFSVTDASGNVGTASATVVVQHNPGETAVDSGPHYSVCCHGGTCPP